MKTAEAIIKSLESEGIRYIFGVPGEENLDLLDAINKSSIEFVVTRHEQSAGFMAATVGRLTGTPGVALATLGPGATNLVTAAAYAQLGGMPLIMLTGQKPIRHSKQGAFQIVDIVDMMKPLTKLSKQLVEGSQAAATIREAVRLASLERPGATLIEVPEDVAAESVTYKAIPISSTRRPIAETKAIQRTIELLLAAKKPLLLIGAGANRKRTSKMLTELVHEYSIPFVTTQLGKGVLSEKLAEYGGTAALSAGDFVHDVIAESDLILNIGHDVIEKPPFIMQGDKTVVHINFESAVINDIYFPQHEVVGDIANSIWQIKEALGQKRGELAWDTTYHQAAISRQRELFEADLAQASTLSPQVVVHEIRYAVPDGGIVALDNGMYKIWFARHYETLEENTLLLDNALATMGAGLPSAIAAKLLQPERPVVAVCGDGGFMMNSQELETALRLKMDLTVVILNDSSYQMIRWKQQAAGFKDFGLQFKNPDFVAYAQSYGARGVQVRKPGELQNAIADSIKSGGVTVIEAQIDYTKNSADLEHR